MPPFGGYLSDYATPGNENLKALIYLTDFSNPVYDIKLKVKIEGQGITIQSKPFYYSNAFSLMPGQPLQLSGSDLSGLLNSNNLDFSGISKSQYELRKVLPEGFYKICFTAYDNNNPVQIKVSNESCAMGWMVLSDPPFLNTPVCNSTVTITNPQNIMFSWTPMNMSSPNSAANTEYEFSLYEVRPDGQNPNNIIQTLPPVFTTTVTTPFFNYGITETPLIAGMQYVWRVKAIDISGRDLFKNNGYSQICTFNWGTKYEGMGDLNIFIGATPLTHRSAKMVWDSIPVFTSYHMEYRKAGGGWNWMPVNTSNARTKVFDLEPETDYEVHVNGTTSDGYTGQWSNTATFRTPPTPVINCEDVSPPATMQNFQPLTKANIGMIWNIGQFEMIIASLQNTQSTGGQYTGQGRVLLPFGGLGIAGTFTNIVVNSNQIVVQGNVEAITKGVDKWLQQHNDNIEHEIVTNINGTIDTIIVNSNGTIQITTTDGNTTTITNQAAGGNQNQIINDSAGNSYVITPNGTVIYVSADAGNIIKLALQDIKSTFTSTVSVLNQAYDNAKQQIEQANGLSTTSNNQEQFNETIIEEEDETLTSSQAQNLSTETNKMISFKDALINKRKWFVLNEMAVHYLDKKSYAELGLIIIAPNQILIEQIDLKLKNNEMENSIVLYISNEIQEFVEKIILSRINKN